MEKNKYIKKEGNKKKERLNVLDPNRKNSLSKMLF